MSKSKISVDLKGQVAIVTGAGRGIGKAIAAALVENGATVVLAARTAGQIEAVAQELGERCLPLVTDIAQESSILELFNFVDSRFKKLDILVNNAGIGLFGPFKDFSTQDYDRILQINARGTYLCCREALKRMVPTRSGAILNISSVVGFKGYIDQSAYAASKHAVVGMTKTLVAEAQPYNIRVSLIHPGGTDTGLVVDARPDLDRSVLMRPEDIAQGALFLLGLPDRCAVDELYIRRFNSKPF